MCAYKDMTLCQSDYLTTNGWIFQGHDIDELVHGTCTSAAHEDHGIFFCSVHRAADDVSGMGIREGVGIEG